MLGDLRGYLVPGATYVDDGLPDGHHCYRVVAMDGAGNVSAPSNEICRTLDNRPPRAVIVQPADGARFEFALSLMADTPDLDVASVQFQLRTLGSADWQNLGAARTDGAVDRDARPFEPDVRQLRAAGGGDGRRRRDRSRAGADPRRLRRHDGAACARGPHGSRDGR